MPAKSLNIVSNFSMLLASITSIVDVFKLVKTELFEFSLEKIELSFSNIYHKQRQKI